MMRNIKWRFAYPGDIDRVRIALHGIDVAASDLECAVLWECASRDRCAGWLVTDGYTDEHIIGIIREAIRHMGHCEDSVVPECFAGI